MLLKLTVKKILEAAHTPTFKWTLQGMGMLRLYLSSEVRLHVWHPKFAVPNVSTIHTHPWDFVSTVVAGQLTNIRYENINDADFQGLTMDMKRGTIKCGTGGGMVGSMPEPVTLSPHPHEIYVEGKSYAEKAEEIHETIPLPGTVTLVERKFKADTEHAFVFWPSGQQWVTAEPRPATVDEVHWITQAALNRWFG